MTETLFNTPVCKSTLNYLDATVAALVKVSSFTFVTYCYEVSYDGSSIDSTIEQVWCEVSPPIRSEKFLVGCIYRSPLNLYVNKELHLSERHSDQPLNCRCSKSQYAGMCSAGDFNYPDLRWSEDMVIVRVSANGPVGSFLDTLEYFSFHQSICTPTFFQANSPPTNTNALDLIIS